MPVISLLTDFGLSDPFVGIMKGVILKTASCQPEIIDITHEVGSYSICYASLILKSAYRYFPENTIHVVVVDPEVGSSRKIILVRTEKYFYLAPDNGVLTYVFDNDTPLEIRSVTNTHFFLPEVSNTFHGRDVFAPVAAHLANGIPFAEFGEKTDSIVTLEKINSVKEKGRITGEIVYIDKFGNLITSISKAELTGKKIGNIYFKDIRIEEISFSYKGEYKNEYGALAIFDSFDHLEIAIYMANAQKELNAELKDKVILEYEEVS